MADFDHNQIDDLIHSRLRLAVMAVLASVERAEFSFVRDKVKATDGNLGAHLRKLEEAGYVRLDKSFIDRKPRTHCSLTDRGRKALRAYVEKLGQLVAAPKRN